MAKSEKKLAKKQRKLDKKDAKRQRKIENKQYKIDKKERKKAIRQAKKAGTYKKEDFAPADNRIRVGVIGCGGIFNGAHVPAYFKERNRVKVVALCDIIGERAEKAKKRFFKEADVYTDYLQMLEDETIDVIDICTPNYLHSIIAVDALNAGKHVFCEKPDAINPEEAAKMYEAAGKNEKMLMIMRNNRFNPNSQYLKEYIEKGNMGDIYVAHTRWLRRRGIPGKGGWFTTKELSGGGPLIDLGVHMIDLAMWFMDFPKPVSVACTAFSCFADSKVSDSINSRFGDKVEDGIYNVEDLVIGRIRFENGAVLQLEISWASNIEKESRGVELRGTKAGASWTGSHVYLYEENKKGKQKTKHISIAQIIPEHATNISHFFDCLENGDTPCYQMFEGNMIMKIIDALYKSAENDGKEIEIDVFE